MISFLFPKRRRASGFPEEFDAGIYRKNPDLKQLPRKKLWSHYKAHGRDEGRACSSVQNRADFLKLLPAHGPVLEIGPFQNPSLFGQNVSYFDLMDREGLQQRAASLGLDPAKTPEIDYVSPIGDLGIVERTFAAVFSAHCIEHQPDLLMHLAHVGRMLGSGGHYFLVVPDKRYCFDRFIPETEIAEVLAAHQECRQVHSFRTILTQMALTCHNDTGRHWHGDHGPEPVLTSEHIAAARSHWEQAAGGYIDAHAWQFTPGVFAELINGLHAVGRCPFTVQRVYGTLRGSNEFYAILHKAPA